MDLFFVPIIVAALLIVFLVIMTVKIVPQAHRFNIERFLPSIFDPNS